MMKAISICYFFFWTLPVEFENYKKGEGISLIKTQKHWWTEHYNTALCERYMFKQFLSCTSLKDGSSENCCCFSSVSSLHGTEGAKEASKKLHFIFTRGNSVAKITFYCKIKLNLRPLQKDYKNFNYGLKNSLSTWPKSHEMWYTNENSNSGVMIKL